MYDPIFAVVRARETSLAREPYIDHARRIARMSSLDTAAELAEALHAILYGLALEGGPEAYAVDDIFGRYDVEGLAAALHVAAQRESEREAA